MSKYGNLRREKITPTQEELEKIEKNYIISVNGNKLSLVESPAIVRDKKDEEKKTLLEKAKDDKLTNIDIANFLTKYL